MGEKENEKRKTEENYGVSILTMKGGTFSWLFRTISENRQLNQQFKLWDINTEIEQHLVRNYYFLRVELFCQPV